MVHLATSVLCCLVHLGTSTALWRDTNEHMRLKMHGHVLQLQASAGW
jgi:hypothetical protein